MATKTHHQAARLLATVQPRSWRDVVSRLSLSTKVTALVTLALAFLSFTSVATVLKVMGDNAKAEAALLQEQHMGIGWEVLNRYGTSFRADGQTLYAGTQPLNDFNAPVDRIRELVGGTATIFRGDTRIATNVKKADGGRAVGTPLAAGPAYEAVLKNGVPYRGRADILGKDYFTAYDPIKASDGTIIGVLYVGIPADEVMAGITKVREHVAIASLIVTLLAGGLCLFVVRRMFRPLLGMQNALEGLAKGDHTSAVPGTDRHDEIGRMAGALDILRDVTRAKVVADDAKARGDAEQAMVVQTVSGYLSDLSNGDLTVSITVDFPPEYGALKNNFNDALAKLRDLIGAVGQSAEGIRTGSSEIAQASEDLARRTEGNAASLEETSAALVQIDGRLKATAVAAGHTVARADQAITTVGVGRATAEEAVAAMGRVSGSAKGIASVIEGVDKIAFQTRVLAMNAAVEAGRAGDAGRGFAVVADLVSALAMRAEEEAKRARDQLTVTQTDILTAVEAVQKVDGALANISGDVGEVHKLLGSMASDNQAQSSTITEISAAISTMDQSTQQNAAMVEQTSAAARNLTTEVGALAEQAAMFKVDANSARRGRGAATRSARSGSERSTVDAY